MTVREKQSQKEQLAEWKRQQREKAPEKKAALYKQAARNRLHSRFRLAGVILCLSGLSTIVHNASYLLYGNAVLFGMLAVAWGLILSGLGIASLFAPTPILLLPTGLAFLAHGVLILFVTHNMIWVLVMIIVGIMLFREARSARQQSTTVAPEDRHLSRVSWGTVMTKWIVRGAILLGIPLYLVFILNNGNPIGRWMWKNAAIDRITDRMEDSGWVPNEIARMTSVTNQDSYWPPWLSQELIVMTNGEWIAYASICRKSDFWIKDIFIGRGSDEKWYYSSYHFCVGMCAMMMDYDMPERPQPESIAAFAQRHALREFDGESNECLKKTW